MDKSLRKKNLCKSFQYLGEGGSRIVFALNDEAVIKVPKNDFGLFQNDSENYIYNHAKERFKKYLCPIIEYRQDLLIAVRAMPLNEDREYFDSLRLFCGNISFYKDILALSKEFALRKNDIRATSSWGILNKEKVIIDYGMTK